ncbi:MAG: PIN-like domain-containing protein [Lutibacter sp.]
MNKDNIKPYIIDAEKEKRLWYTAVFVFDSSALLDFYFLPMKTREKIYEEIFSNLVDRLWIPFHVEYEFLKNREGVIPKPVKEKYEPLKDKIIQIRKSLAIEIQKRVDEISRETIKDDKHPHIEQIEVDKIKTHIENFEKEIKSFEENILKQITTAEKEILGVKTNDDILKALEDYFTVGREFTYDEIIVITEEGKHRYEFKIPPGYGDLQQKDKKGTQIFGDLIIWKQILEFSKEKKLPVIFITNDIKKDDDWCYLDKSVTEDRILSPREELIKEIKDHSSVEFWMYNLPQFLYNANKYLAAKFTTQTIQNITQFLNTKSDKGDYLRFKCESCGKIHSYHKSNFNLEFDCIESNERSMGPENHYEAVEVFDCECGNQITATFEVWEYPVGIHNYDTLTLEGGEILESFFFTIDFFEDDYEPDYTSCDLCSGNRDGMGNIVNFWDELELENEYDTENKNSKYDKVVSGNCEWCNSLHIRCPKCDSINPLPDTEFGKPKECEGGCGLIFLVDTSDDHDPLGEFSLKLIDHRKEECQSCGQEFINTGSTEICDECEKKYGEE